ncbi:MAG: hypothetical protein LDL30_12175 [Desulfovibrio sp.]|nr:hypothetical protein [Desulfovibrio sp.]
MPEYTTKTHRDSPFLFQMRVPASLSPAFGRKTIRLSLRTYEPTKARNMARRMAVLCQEAFRQFEELPVHQHCIHATAEGGGRGHLHGRPRPLAGQRLH